MVTDDQMWLLDAREPIRFVYAYHAGFFMLPREPMRLEDKSFKFHPNIFFVKDE